MLSGVQAAWICPGDVTGDGSRFDVAWIPAPFIAQSALRAGVPRVAAALRPGGWLMLGHGKLGGTRGRAKNCDRDNRINDPQHASRRPACPEETWRAAP